MPQVLELKTERLILEPLQSRHAALLFQTLSDPAIYIFIPFDPPKSVEALAERYGHLSVGHSADGKDIWLNFALRKLEDDAYVGTVQATITGKRAYVAYELGPAHWGKGYATEAVRTLIAHLFKDYKVEVIRAETDTRNDRSATLLERLGFVQIEKKENADHFKGSPSHEFIYELLREAWG
ncbi:MAG: GNAT family N-acetyltransferase [candidate division Zixibacteria bacterium]|nr:GNAT family N-acetyltransferase [candidate division Zixibacteria bacterium]